MKDVLAGVDLGGTSIKFALATFDGKSICDASIPTDGHLGSEDVIERITRQLQHLSEKHDSKIIAIGVGVPGLVDIKNGITKFLPNLPGQWREVPMADHLGKAIGCKVKIANDARTATLGELKFGHGKVCPDATLAFFTIGTGIGGGIAIDGKLRLGALGAAGEIGHQTILKDGPQCGCGNHGCLETLASGTAIASEGIRLMNSGLAPNLYTLVEGDASRVSVAEMAKVVDLDNAIRDAILTAANYVGIAAANVVTILHPDMIVLGGGVAEIGGILIDTVKRTIVDRVGMFPTDSVEVKRSELGTKAGVLGAVGLAMDITSVN